MTIIWGAEFKIGKDVVGVVELGKVFTVDGVSGNWCHFRGKHGWMKKDNFRLIEEAVSHFTSMISDSPEAKNYHHRGIAWRERGEYQKAIRDIQFAIKINEREASYYNSLGTVYHRLNQFQEAKENYNKALQLSPNNIGFMNNRGIASRELGQYSEALQDFDEAIKLAPRYAYAYGSKAWLYATAKNPDFTDGKKAISFATRACELTKWKEDELLGTLAAAYGREGHYSQAQKWLKSAVAINPDKYQELRQAMKHSFDLNAPFAR
ncbi:MAG: tetratricopeptide repeat protein [Planctomycetota bacterium]|nr:tetratricopeptide repeat protein [Planctomycetota bacterium]